MLQQTLKTHLDYNEDVLSEDTSLELEQFLLNSSWKWGFKSLNGMKRSIPHWSIIFAGPEYKEEKYYDCESELHGIIKKIWQCLKPKYFKDDVLVRCYANAVTSGIDQILHRDDLHPSSKTCIVYANKNWNVDWCGETIVWDREKRQISESYLPKSRSILIIPGSCWHGVRPVSHYCDEIRMSLMFKTRSKDVI